MCLSAGNDAGTTTGKERSSRCSSANDQHPTDKSQTVVVVVAAVVVDAVSVMGAALVMDGVWVMDAALEF